MGRRNQYVVYNGCAIAIIAIALTDWGQHEYAFVSIDLGMRRAGALSRDCNPCSG